MGEGIFDKALDKMIQANKENNPPEEKDYMGEDGFLHCSVCHEAKEQRMTIAGRERVMFRDCACRREAIKKEMEEDRRRDHQRKVSELRGNAYRNKSLAEWTFENDDRKNGKIPDAMKRYADKFDEFYRDGQGLLLYGAVGTGKSYYAACIVNRLIDNEYSAHMTNFSRIINTMQNGYDGKQEYLDSFNSFKLLVLDDLGIERETSFMNEQVYNIIDNRYRSDLPMIITTNIAYSDIVNCKDMDKRRIYDRILEVCHPVEVKGESRRLIAVKEKTQRINKILGL